MVILLSGSGRSKQIGSVFASTTGQWAQKDDVLFMPTGAFIATIINTETGAVDFFNYPGRARRFLCAGSRAI